MEEGGEGEGEEEPNVQVDFDVFQKITTFFLEGVLTRSKKVPPVLDAVYTIKISKRSKCSRQINCDGRKMDPTAAAYRGPHGRALA